MLKLRSLFSGFRSSVNIERAYKDLDSAISGLRSYNDNPDGTDKEELDAIVQEAIGDANALLELKAEKTWDGLFREMHEYLAKIHMELTEYDKAEEHARFVLEYDRHEGEYLLQQIEAHKRGERLEDFDPSTVDEADDE
ncbi:MAG: hypothetical protein O3A46_04150 [Candidatus Poribacteria bacterium]|nr:hypothetical protein [Candidatus Poribacteria bacterium]